MLAKCIFNALCQLIKPTISFERLVGGWISDLGDCLPALPFNGKAYKDIVVHGLPDCVLQLRNRL